MHRGLPSGSLTFIISLDGPVEALRFPGGRQSPGGFQAFVGGLHASPAVLKQPRRQSGVVVKPRPAGCRALFGLPAAALAWSVVDLAELFGPSVAGLVDRLVAVPEPAVPESHCGRCGLIHYPATTFGQRSGWITG